MMCRSITSSGVLGAPSTFSANTSLLDGSTQDYVTSIDITDIQTDFSYFVWVKNTLSSKGRVGRTDFDNDDGNLLVQIDADGEFTVVIGHSSGGGQTVVNSSGVQLNDGNWHLIGCVVNTTTITMYVDGLVEGSENTLYDAKVGGVFTIGSNYSSGNYYNGSLAFATLGTGMTGAQVTEMYGDGTPTCFDSMSTGLKDTMEHFWDLSNDGITLGGEITDRIGSADLIPNNSPTYTDQGLTVDCTP